LHIHRKEKTFKKLAACFRKQIVIYLKNFARKKRVKIVNTKIDFVLAKGKWLQGLGGY